MAVKTLSKNGHSRMPNGRSIEGIGNEELMMNAVSRCSRRESCLWGVGRALDELKEKVCRSQWARRKRDVKFGWIDVVGF